MSKTEAGIVPVGDGAFLVARPDGSRGIAYGVVDGPRTWVFLDGVTHVVEPARRHRPGGGQDDSALAAPMPAAVTQIHVAVGQAVAPPDLLVTLEAMKMELPIRAPVSGTVTAINCRVGELVQPGMPLVELQASGPDNAALRTGNGEA